MHFNTNSSRREQAPSSTQRISTRLIFRYWMTYFSQLYDLIQNQVFPHSLGGYRMQERRKEEREEVRKWNNTFVARVFSCHPGQEDFSDTDNFCKKCDWAEWRVVFSLWRQTPLKTKRTQGLINFASVPVLWYILTFEEYDYSAVQCKSGDAWLLTFWQKQIRPLIVLSNSFFQFALFISHQVKKGQRNTWNELGILCAIFSIREQLADVQQWRFPSQTEWEISPLWFWFFPKSACEWGEWSISGDDWKA